MIDHATSSQRLAGLDDTPAPWLSAIAFVVFIGQSVTLNDLPHVNPNSFSSMTLRTDANITPAPCVCLDCAEWVGDSFRRK